MKILCVHQGYELYGSDKTFIQSVKAFREGYPDAFIQVLLPKEGTLTEYLEPYADQIDYKDLWILRKTTVKSLAGTGLFTLFGDCYKAWKLMREYDFTYINTAVVLNFIIASFLSFSSRVVHVHEIPTGFSRFVFSSILIWSRSAIIYNSQATMNSFFIPFWQTEKIIPNGVAMPDVKILSENKETIDCLNILMIGRLNDWKGQDLLIKALHKIDISKLNHVAVKIVGDVFEDQHHFKNELIEFIISFGLENIVELIGFQKNPEDFYLWSDLVVVPSKKPEPFGLVAIEAMSYGKPVIAANHGGLKDIVEQDVTGFLFTPNDSDALSEIIFSVIDNPIMLSKMGKAGFSRFEELFTEKRYMQEISMLPKLL